MKKALAALLVLAGLAGSGAAAQQARALAPDATLFSTPTVADDEAPVTPLKGKIAPADLVLPRDAWRQIEFFPASREQEVRQTLSALAAFQREQQAAGGWKKIYRRKLPAQPVIAGAGALDTLARDLGVEVRPGPLINPGANALPGRLAHGFALPVGRGVTLYGVSDASGVGVLAARVEEGAEEEALTNAFVKLNAKRELILVDWRSHLLMSGVARGGTFVTWRPERN